MGYCLAVGKCVACPAVISFNPKKVPSIRVRWDQGRPIPDATGTREPLCRACAEAINADLRKKGENPREIAADAYEGCPEEELEL